MRIHPLESRISYIHQETFLSYGLRLFQLLGLLEIGVVSQPGPALKVCVGERRFFSNHIQPRFPHFRRLKNGGGLEWPITEIGFMPRLSNEFWVRTTSKNRRVAIFRVRQKRGRFSHRRIEVIALRDKPRQIFRVRDEVRQSGW